MATCRLALLLCLASGCSLLVPQPGDFTYGGDGSVPDGGLDGSLADASPDASLDAGADAGACGACSASLPFCDEATGECVACLEASHCDDGDFCTEDRCSLSFECRNDVTRDCIAQLEAGRAHTCAREAEGNVSCWGDNLYGQLGLGSMGAGTNQLSPRGTMVGRATDLSCGSEHCCALTNDQGVLCWGRNAAGQLGADPGVTPASGTPLTLNAGVGVRAVSAGGAHTCVVYESGAVRCWGAVSPSATSSFAGVDVPTLNDATQVSCGTLSTCALRANGRVACWGERRVLGATGAADSLVDPVEVEGLAGAVAVTVGPDHACALLESGGAACWGLGEEGKLGDGSMTDSQLPVIVSGLSDGAVISVEGPSCSVRSGGGVVCWGPNRDGELGNGMMEEIRTTPGSVNAIDDAVAIGTGGFHACARLESGSVVCWGLGSSGQIGDGSTDTRSLPVTVIAR